MPLIQRDFFTSPLNRQSIPVSLRHGRKFLTLVHRSIGSISTRSKIGRDEIKWQELLLHFRSVQAKHEKLRRQALGTDSFSGFSDLEKSGELPGTAAGAAGVGRERIGRPLTNVRPPMRRTVTGEIRMPPPVTSVPAISREGALSPLNPRARGQSGLVPTQLALHQKAKRTMPMK